jgi:hypothetical protein
LDGSAVKVVEDDIWVETNEENVIQKYSKACASRHARLDEHVVCSLQLLALVVHTVNMICTHQKMPGLVGPVRGVKKRFEPSYVPMRDHKACEQQ